MDRVSKLRTTLLIFAAVSVVFADDVDLRVIQSVKANDEAAVRQLIQRSADINTSQGDGSTALHWAIYRNNLAITNELIAAGANVNATNDDGATPLQVACMTQNSAMVERLLKAGANPNAKLLNGETVLMTCSRVGESAAVNALLEHGADTQAVETAHHQTALMWAAAEGHPAVTRLLLQAGADFRARSVIYPQRVLGQASKKENREEMTYVVERGGSTALLFAARAGDAESAKLLLEAGADANDSLSDGASAMVVAAQSGHGDFAELLLDHGADPNAAAVGYTAMHAAILRSELNLVQSLLAHGANPNAKITKGEPVRRSSTDYYLPASLIGATPYLLAAKFLETDIMRALAAGGADIKIAMPNGATALMLAVGLGSSQTASRRGISALSFAEVEPESRVVQGVTAVIELGADVNAGNQAGNTALHIAASTGYDNVVQFLADHGAQLDAKNKRGQTALGTLLALGKNKDELVLDGVGAPVVVNQHLSTVALLRKLGATEQLH